MPKMPSAPPAVRTGAPSIEAITPQPVPVPPLVVPVEVTGSSFDADIAVNIVRNGAIFAVLTGTPQIQDLTPAGFSFANSVFKEPGVYGLFVRNQSGSTSEMMPFSVVPVLPAITAAAPCPGGVSVTGNGFQPNLAVFLASQDGTPVNGVMAEDVTPASCKAIMPVALSPGMYSIRITNPDGTETAPYLFQIPAAS